MSGRAIELGSFYHEVAQIFKALQFGLVVTLVGLRILESFVSHVLSLICRHFYV